DRSLDYFVFGLLKVTYEARHYFLSIKAKKNRVAANERQKIKLIGDGIVAVALDHSHIMRRNVRLVRDLLSRKTTLLASLSHELAERLINFETRPGRLGSCDGIDCCAPTLRGGPGVWRLRSDSKFSQRVAWALTNRDLRWRIAHQVSLAQANYIVRSFEIVFRVSGETNNKRPNNRHPPPPRLNPLSFN